MTDTVNDYKLKVDELRRQLRSPLTRHYSRDKEVEHGTQTGSGSLTEK